MQQWEYLSISVYLGANGRWYLTHESKERLLLKEEGFPDLDVGSTLDDFMNGLGNKGWELVSEYPDPKASRIQWRYTWLWADHEWKELKTADGKTYQGMQGYMDYINEELGMRQWELVTMTENVGMGGYNMGWLLLFKCPIEEKVLLLRFKRPNT